MLLKMIVEVTYEVDLDDYPSTNSMAVAETDQQNFDEDPAAVLEMINDEGYEVRVIPTYE